MIKNPPYGYENDKPTVNGKTYDKFIIVSKGDWFIQGTEVCLECPSDNEGILNVMNGWIIKNYQVRQDEETCGIDEFIFIDRDTKEEYEFDHEPLGIIKG